MVNINIDLPEGTIGFHAVNMMGMDWTISASVHVPEGDDYVVSVENADLQAGLVDLKEKLDAHA